MRCARGKPIRHPWRISVFRPNRFMMQKPSHAAAIMRLVDRPYEHLTSSSSPSSWFPRPFTHSLFFLPLRRLLRTPVVIIIIVIMTTHCHHHHHHNDHHQHYLKIWMYYSFWLSWVLPCHSRGQKERDLDFSIYKIFSCVNITSTNETIDSSKALIGGYNWEVVSTFVKGIGFLRECVNT